MIRSDARPRAETLSGGTTTRPLSLHRLVTVVSVGVGLLLCAAVAAIIVQNARHAVEEETAAAFRTAQATVTIRMPPRFAGEDTMDHAIRLSQEIDALRHVSSIIIDTHGNPLRPRAEGLERRDDDTAPDWFSRLMRPQIRTDYFPVSHYPNVLGSLVVASDPSDEIAEVWEDFRIIMPLLVLTAVALTGMTMAVSALILRRLQAIQQALGAIRQGDLARRAPGGRLAEFAALAEGVNDLAAHLRAERAENDLLHRRLLTLSETERARIASDLHDEMGPQLFALNAALTQAQAAAQQKDGGPGHEHLDEALRAAALHARAVRDSARAAIDDLRPMLQGHGVLAEMLAELPAEFAESAPGVAIAVDADPDISAGELAELSIYRFARESLLNAIRHGAARRITISLHGDDPDHPGQIVTRIADDGQGPSDRIPARSHGLIGIRDRARALGATFLPPHREGNLTVTELRMPRT